MPKSGRSIALFPDWEPDHVEPSVIEWIGCGALTGVMDRRRALIAALRVALWRDARK
jgi:hypothetical protein